MAIRNAAVAQPAIAEPGHNMPPLSDDEALRQALGERAAALIKRRDELLEGIKRAPAVIENDEVAGTMGDFSQKQIAACINALKDRRVAEKEPFLSGGRTVDGYFHSIMKPLEDGKATIDARRKTYLDKKAAAERAARIEAERKAREEADRQAREAADAAAKLSSEADLSAAIAAEDRAKQAAADAEQAARAAAAKPAELSRVRGDYGSVSSLKQFWDFADMERATLDLDAIRDHLPLDAIEKAVRSFIRAGGRELRGCRIFENTRL